MPRGRKKKISIPIENVKHKDKRTNIPTRELQSFVKEDEAKPKVILYPRDTSLDPQLVWKGKDEQDSKDLAVPAVPVYIQEKIHPRVIIEDLKKHQPKDSGPVPQLGLFGDFNGLPFEEQIDFYHHQNHWTNRMILGDSLLVMNSLAEKEGLKGKVQMIYIDPPYGIKFNSNWQVSTRKHDLKDGKVEDATRQPEQVKAYRDSWELGIHSYLSYLRDRFIVAREHLTESGSLFVQINSENSHLVAMVLDEVFGSDNFVANIIFRKKSLPLGAKLLETMHDHILFYAKDRNVVKYRELYEYMENVTAHWRFAELPDGQILNIKSSDFMSKEHPNGTRYFRSFSLIAPSYSENTNFKYKYEGHVYSPPSGGSWVVSKEKLDSLVRAGRIQVEGESLSYKLYHDDFPFRKITNLWSDVGVSYEKIYAVQTTPQIIERCLLMSTDPGDLVLDPTCGSGTTAYVAEEWGRRWITIDTSRVAVALARTRLMAARYPYYILTDSPEGISKEAEVTGKVPLGSIKTESDVKKGFVYERVAHVTLKSIANNSDIKEGMSRAEVDVAIAKHADTELLYDKPYEDNKRVRVSGPFTVESLSPHRVLSSDEERPASEKGAGDTSGAGQFETMITDNLKKAGVQNTVRNERLTFDRLEPFAGIYIHAAGEYTENKISKRVAVCIGPEHSTVGPELIKDAAKEAMQGVGFDLLLVCGFAFDAHASETVKQLQPTAEVKKGVVAESSKQYGKLTVLLARMNPDLAMGDDLLKKTGAGNLFMVFGEPDVEIKKQKDGRFIATIKGVDVYDPTTGQVRNHTTDDIACWFIDTSYNEESFFVRHAYFCGADEPYDKLKRALRAEINESAWSTLYSTESRPFDPPQTGKIAVKVINHYGDEVLKVYKI